MSTIGRGGTITLDATFTDGAGTLVDPTTPLVDVLNPSSLQVLTDAVPIRDSLGFYHYDYAVDVAAPLGAWTAHWTGTINGAAVNDDDAFTVVLAGDISFDETDAETLIKQLTSWEDDPALSQTEIDRLLVLARRPDSDDLTYGDTDWTATFDVYAAAAEGWRWKAGKASARFNFAEDGQRFDRSQIYAHCIAQADQYSRRGMGSIPVTST